MKFKIMTILIFFMSITLANADTVTLRNGQVIEGNVVEIFEEEKAILFDVIIDGKLVGGKIKLYGTDIAIVEVNDTYRKLKRKELTLEERERDNELYRERLKSNSSIDDKIISRTERNTKRRIKQREREEDKVHEKDVINQRHYNRKDLITHSVNEHVKPKVIIKDSNEDRITREEYYRDRE